MTTEDRPDSVESAEDDSAEAIGRGLRISAIGFLALGGLAAVVLAVATRPDEVVEDVAEPIALPSGRQAVEESVPAIPFVNITAESGVDFVHQNRATGQKLLPETMGGGCAFLDYDQDGDQDLLLVDSNQWPWDVQESPGPSLRLYANDGAGRFVEKTAEAGIEIHCYGMGVAVGDYDNDGDSDVFVTAVGPNTLLRNDDGRFVEVTESAGVAGEPDAWGSSCGWFDYDNDGDLDLVVGNYVAWSREIDIEQDFTLAGVGRAYGPPFSFAGSFPYLYRNEGDGTFTDVSEPAGVRVTNAATGVPLAKTLGVRPVDVDRDGWADLVLANDTVQNLLLLNNRDGTFREAGAETGIAFDAGGKARGAMGIDAGRFRGDGSLGVAIGNFAGEMTALYVAGQQGAVFTDDAIPTGLGPPTRLDLSFGLFFFDADLDGRLDLFSANGHIEGEINRFQKSQRYRQPSRLFWNAGDGGRAEFVAVESTGQLAEPLVGRGAAYADIDGDGDLDVVVTQIAGPVAIYRNDQATGNHYVRLRLRGGPSNRDAIGATVAVRVGDSTHYGEVAPTRSYLSQVELPVTIGIGDADAVDRVTVRWPDGSEQTIDDAPIDQTLTLQQETPSGEAP